jgi:hypothetical protein
MAVESKKQRAEAQGQLVFPTDLQDLLVPVAQLQHYPGNARVHDLDVIEKSMAGHGMYAPVVVQRSTNYVLVGNGRLEVARDRLGWTHIAAVFLDVDDEQAESINVIDNRSSDLATNDPQKLLEQLRRIQARKARVDQRAAEMAGQTVLANVLEDGFTIDDVETLEAQLGENGVVEIEKFVGQYQTDGKPAKEVSERQVAQAVATGRAAGMKEIVLILTPDQHSTWLAKMEECKKAWGCKSGSEAAVELIKRAPSFAQ